MGEYKVDWDFFEQFLGYVPDRYIAHKAQCTIGAVQKRRKKLKIKACQKQPEYFWDNLLGKVSDCDISKFADVNRSKIIRRRQKLGIPRYNKINWNKYDKMLGLATDKELSEATGATRSCFIKRRKKLGITPRSIEKFDQYYDEFTDPEIAEYSGYPLWEIALRRAKLERELFGNNEDENKESFIEEGFPYFYV